jgi:imidazolonepropionase-like amidohydrolase
MLLIKNAMIATMKDVPQDGCDLAFRGYLLVQPPLIRAVGAGDPPADLAGAAGLTVVDAAGGWLLPGLIDGHCHTGLFNDGLTLEGEDGNEATDPVTPQLQAIDGIFQDDRSFGEALSGGVTTVMTGPGSANVLAGRFALLRTSGRTVEAMTIRAHAAMKAAFGENPKKVYGRKDKTPATRMATAAVLREALEKARHYARQKEKAAVGGETAVTETDLRWEALLPVLRGEMLLKIHAHRTDDILTGVRIANEYGLRYTLEHCTEGYLIADILAREYQAGKAAGRGEGKPGLGKLEGIIAGPLLGARSKPELNRETAVNPAILADAGLPVALMTDHPELPIQYLAVAAAVAARDGLGEGRALAAITITAARLCDAAASLGSLEAGKVADLALFSGHPLEFRSKVLQTYSQGVLVWADGKPVAAAQP